MHNQKRCLVVTCIKQIYLSVYHGLHEAFVIKECSLVWYANFLSRWHAFSPDHASHLFPITHEKRMLFSVWITFWDLQTWHVSITSTPPHLCTFYFKAPPTDEWYYLKCKFNFRSTSSPSVITTTSKPSATKYSKRNGTAIAVVAVAIVVAICLICLSVLLSSKERR